MTIKPISTASGPIPTLKNDRTVTVEYTNTTIGVLPQTINTGVNPTLFANDVDITVSFQFSGGGNTYALFEQTTAGALVANPNIRIVETGEADGVVGNANMTYYYDGIGDLVVILGFDAGGKTAVSLTITSGFNTPVCCYFSLFSMLCY